MTAHEVEVIPSREAQVAAMRVRRALPTRGRRTVGAWCFVDHMGPMALDPNTSVDVAPHPHMGLQTVTWLFSGAFLHRDSLGSEQLIRPGQLNLMTSGHGVAHAEENPGLRSGEMHGMQLWVAQPTSTRDGDAGFQHFAELPKLASSTLDASVLVGSFGGVASPARRDSDHVAVELDFHGGVATVPLVPAHEYALIVADGSVLVDGVVVEPGALAYLGTGRDEIGFESKAPSRALLIGGLPFDERLFMWWNFVARSRDEISEAWRAWASGDERFGRVDSSFARIDVSPPPWLMAMH
jgi:redox-sensitive bicupin YhaK (pirin superfamily)